MAMFFLFQTRLASEKKRVVVTLPLCLSKEKIFAISRNFSRGLLFLCNVCFPGGVVAKFVV